MKSIIFLYVCLSILSLHLITAAGDRWITKQDKGKLGAVNSADVPEECRHQTFCTIKPKNYPEDAIRKIFEGKTVFQGVTPLDDSLTNKFGGDPLDEDDCIGVASMAPLTLVRASMLSEDWRTVVLDEGTFEQQVRLERCSNPGATCFKDFLKPANKQVVCQEQTTVFSLLVWNNVTGEPEPFDAELPVCCACHYKK